MAKPEDRKPVDELLSIVNAIDPDNRSKEEQPPTDDELGEARRDLTEALKAAAEGTPDLEAMRTIRQAIDSIDAEQETRKEAAEQAKLEAAKLLEGVDGTEEELEAEAEEKAEGEEGDAKAEAKTEDAEDAEDAKEPAKAKVAGLNLAEALKGTKQRQDAKRYEIPENPNVIVKAVGDAQGYGLAQDATIDDVANIFDRYSSYVTRGGKAFVHLERVYPDNRTLSMSTVENTRKLDAVMSPRAIVAAGGICDPLPADFTHPICGDRGRPIRDGLPNFRADRGGVRYAPTATVDDLVGAITVWTSENDADPSSPATKDCPRVECEDELTAQVDAIVACLTVGNFQARFNPEFWRSRLDLLFVAHDQQAEVELYNAILAAASTTRTGAFASASGTVVDILHVIARQVAAIRSRHRFLTQQFRTILPDWTREALRVHLAHQAPSGSLDQFTVADAQLAQFFATYNVTPIWSPDIDRFGAQAADAALLDFPGGDVDVVTFPEGTFAFMDGGTLDLGTQIQDSTLNATNDRQAFMETFEGILDRGCEALVTEVALGNDCICDGAA